MSIEEAEPFEWRWSELEEALTEFQAMLAPEVPKLRPERSADLDDWQRQKGVYLLFSEQDELLYVGSTLDCFLNRVNCHNRRFLGVKHADFITFPEKYLCLSLALEAYLIGRLRPRMNERGM